MLNGYYTPAQGCDEALNAYCKMSCKNRFTLARKEGPGNQWRCMELSTLSDDTRSHAPGTQGWCTRNNADQLPAVLNACKLTSPPPTPLPSSPSPVAMLQSRPSLPSPSPPAPLPLLPPPPLPPATPMYTSNGYYGPAHGASICEACAAGTFQATTGQTACTACPAGSYCLPRSTAALA